jgi:hypothetical protein
MQIVGAHETMVFRRMVLREVVGTIISSLLPVGTELALANAVSYPIEMHVDGF